MGKVEGRVVGGDSCGHPEQFGAKFIFNNLSKVLELIFSKHTSLEFPSVQQVSEWSWYFCCHSNTYSLTSSSYWTLLYSVTFLYQSWLDGSLHR